MADGVSKTLLDTYHVKADTIIKLPEKTDDFSAIITKLKSENIQTVYLGLWPKAVGLFLRQSGTAGYKPDFISNLCASLQDVANIGGAFSNGLIFTSSPDPQYIPSAQPVIKELAAKNIINRPFAIYGYLLVQIYTQAVQQAGTTESNKVIESLHAKKFDTLMGNLGFTDTGDMTGLDFDYFKWKDGKIISAQLGQSTTSTIAKMKK